MPATGRFKSQLDQLDQLDQQNEFYFLIKLPTKDLLLPYTHEKKHADNQYRSIIKALEFGVALLCEPVSLCGRVNIIRA